jgi:hypothetical protein
VLVDKNINEDETQIESLVSFPMLTPASQILTKSNKFKMSWYVAGKQGEKKDIGLD